MILYDNPQTRVAIGSPHAQQDAMIDGEEPADCVSSFAYHSSAHGPNLDSMAPVWVYVQ